MALIVHMGAGQLAVLAYQLTQEHSTQPTRLTSTLMDVAHILQKDVTV